jgi:hypothetical protein
MGDGGVCDGESACWRLERRVGDASAWVKASTSSGRDFRVALDRDRTGHQKSHDDATPPQIFVHHLSLSHMVVLREFRDYDLRHSYGIGRSCVTRYA